MSTKKNIDELFKERFKDFEAAPSPQVWENIQSQLPEQKEDRKVIPLWWKLGGVAALLALLLTVGNAVFNPSGESTTVVTEEVEPQIDNLDRDNEINPIFSSENKDEKGVASENNTVQNSTEEESDASERISNQNQEEFDRKVSNSKIAEDRVATVSSETKSDKKAAEVIDKEKDAAILSEKKTTEAIALEQNKTNQTRPDIDGTRTEESSPSKTEIATVPNTGESKTSNAHPETKPEDSKPSLFEAIEANETAVATANKPKVNNRWEVAPNIAPVYYGSLGEGSSIDPMFADNTQSGEVNLSYGVQVSYNITDRLSLRSGVSNVDLSYATGGIEVGTGPVALALGGIDYNDDGLITLALDAGSIANNSMSGNPLENVTPKSAGGDVQLVQNIKYYEVPLELKYALINNRIGINVLGGFSTLFLGNNEVSVEANNLNEVLGEANNLNNVSFTTNVGLGFDYKLTKKFKFNIEPMFKYQLNPYTDSSVDFRPYYLGVYSGFSLQF